MTSKVVIAGGSGALGTRLVTTLAGKCDLVVLTRSPNPNANVRQIYWDGETVGRWASELGAPDTALINLAGKLVDCRPTQSNIRELTRSRVAPTRALVQASQQLQVPLAHWVQASTTAIWSDAGETACTETTPAPAAGLAQMTGVARRWEEAFQGANTAHGVVLRTAVVLDPRAAALKRLVALTRLGLGGRVGSGSQWVSWIHIDDWLSIVHACLGFDSGVAVPAGVLVAAAPNPVRNAELMAALRKKMHRPAALPTPVAVVRLGAVLLRTDPALGLTGRHATSKILAELGFRFRHPTLVSALSDLLAPDFKLGGRWVKMMPDYTAPMPLWGDWWDLDLPAPLLRELALWQEDFDRSFHWEHGWGSPQAREAWAKQAARLEPLLRRAVGTRAEVVVNLWPLTADD